MGSTGIVSSCKEALKLGIVLDDFFVDVDSYVIGWMSCSCLEIGQETRDSNGQISL